VFHLANRITTEVTDAGYMFLNRVQQAFVILVPGGMGTIPEMPVLAEKAIERASAVEDR
jgi:hypothetical protein